MAVRGVRVVEKDENLTVKRGRVESVAPTLVHWADVKAFPRMQKGAANPQLANAVVTHAQNIERYRWNDRYASQIFARYLSGRETQGGYSYSLVQRPAAITRSMTAQWRAPTYNALATCADIYSTRIFKNRPYVDVLPLAAGGFRARIRSKYLSRFGDAVLASTQFWDEKAEVLGLDSMEQGTAVAKVHEDDAQSKTIAIDRVLVDELLISDDEALYGAPASLLQRVFMHRRDLIARYGKTPELIAAIERAASVHPAFASGSGDTSYKQIVPLIEGWSKPLSDGTPGRHVLVIPGYVLRDEEYDRHFFPFAVLKFRPMTQSWRGQGLVEQGLSLQAEVDRIMAVMSESSERVAYPRVAMEAGSDVHIEQLAGVPGGAYVYTQTKPTWETPAAINPETWQYLNFLEDKLFKRLGISLNAAQGQRPAGLNSGAAIMANAQIEDSRHVDLAQRWEDFITQIVMLVFAVAEDVKPRVVDPARNGEVIDWDDVRLEFDPRDLTSSMFRARAFPMSRLPHTVAGKEQQVADWLANGQITRQSAMRLGLMPDIEGAGDEHSAAEDAIEYTLDKILDKGKFIAPTPFGDLALTLQKAQSRFLRESTLDTPKDRLRLLMQFILATQEMIADSAQPGAPGAPVGVQPAPGAAPAPSPLQLAPASAPLAAA